MPIYEYLCPQCQARFELMRPMSRAEEGASCPRCSNGARRVPSAVASFSRSADGDTTSLAGGNACSTCSTSSCATCGN